MLIHPGARSLCAIRTYLATIAALFVGGVAFSQTAPVSTVQTVTTPTSPPAAVHQFTATSAGTYTVKLADYGSSIPGGAPLASVGMIVTQGTAVVGTPVSLSQAGSITFTAAANTAYTLHVVGEPAASPGYGVTEEDVSGPSFSQSFADTFTLPSQKASGFGVVNQSFTAAGTGSVSYSVTLTDLAFPAALQSAELILIDNTTSTAVATLSTNSTQLTANSTGNLNAGDSYQLVAFGVAPSAQPDGLFGVSLLIGGTAVTGFPDIVPIGTVTFLKSACNPSKTDGSFTFGSTVPATLAVTDLRFPDNVALSALGAVVVDASAVQAVASSIAGGTSQTSISAPSTTDSYEVFAYGSPGSTAPNGGSYSVTVEQPNGSATSYPFSEAQGVLSSGTTAQTFSIDQSIPGPGPYVFTLTDFGFPAKLTVAALAAVQNGAVLGQLAETGNFNVTAAEGPLTLLVFGGSSSSDGSLLGIDLSPPNGGTSLFDITRGIGAGFSSTPLSVASAQQVQINVADLKFPSALGNLSVALTNGTKLVSYIASAGSSGSIPPTQLSANTKYYVNVIAQPNTSQNAQAGTYAMSVAPSPAVTLSASSSSVTSGSTVTLTWTAQNATSCTASGGSGWQGSETPPSGGSVTTSALVATTTFSLSCSGAGGTANASATVTVTPDPPSGGHGGGGAFDPDLLIALAVLLAMRVRGRYFRSV